jgi:hypothetical protein
MSHPTHSSPTPEDADKFGATDVRIEYGKAADKEEVVYYVDGERKVYVPGSAEERILVRKIDLHMFTCVSVLYLLNYLDRQNVSPDRNCFPVLHFPDRKRQSWWYGSRSQTLIFGLFGCTVRDHT